MFKSKRENGLFCFCVYENWDIYLLLKQNNQNCFIIQQNMTGAIQNYDSLYVAFRYWPTINFITYSDILYE